MPMLDTSKLYGRVNGVWVRGVPTRTTSKGDEYRCPICATGNGDEGGQHLIVFKDRVHYACAAYPGDDKHRGAIWEFAGVVRDGRNEPFIPRKVEQKNTFIGRHIMTLEKEAPNVLLEAERLKRLEKERNARVDKFVAETLKRLDELTNNQTQHIDTISNKVQIGTFGTAISCSTNMPPPPIQRTNTVSNGGGYAIPMCEKASQTSQVRSWRKVAGPEDCGETEEYSGDFGLAFDRNNPKWREHYYLWYRSKYYGEAVAF